MDEWAMVIFNTGINIIIKKSKLVLVSDLGNNKAGRIQIGKSDKHCMAAMTWWDARETWQYLLSQPDKHVIANCTQFLW